MAGLYLVDTDDEFRSRAALYLRLQGFTVLEFISPKEVFFTARDHQPECLISELAFPDDDGFRFIRNLKIEYSRPVVVLSERNSESDRVTAFEMGCDDYVSKPCSLKELQLRINRLIQPHSGRKCNSKIDNYSFMSSMLTIVHESHLVYLDGLEVSLTVSEWKILNKLVNASPAVMTRQQLLLECFPDSLDTYDRIIDSHVKNIRTKLGASGFDWIGTVRGYGYRFSGSKR